MRFPDELNTKRLERISMPAEHFRVIDLLADLCTDKDVFFRYVRLARDLMTTRVQTLTLDDTVYDALQFMKARRCRHVVVVDAPARGEALQAPALIGVVSERDLLRQVSPHWGTSYETDADGKALRKRLTEVVSRKPKCVLPDTPIPHVLRAMCEGHVDMMPVIEGDRLAGVITAGDVMNMFVLLGKIGQLCCEHDGKTRLIDLFADSAALDAPLVTLVGQTVADIMTKEVVTLSPTDILRNAVEAMQQGEFRHLPVVDFQGKVVGVVSDRDVLLHLPPPEAHFQREGAGFRRRLFQVDPAHPALRVQVRDVMTRGVACVAPDCTIRDAAQKLTERGIGCLPVMGRQQRLAGIVTVTDFMRSMLATYKLMATLASA